ncbi:MAG: hypothetical protein ACT4O0_02870 [Pseudonocardia sp.]
MTTTDMSMTPQDRPTTSSARGRGARAGNGLGPAIDLTARVVKLVGAVSAVRPRTRCGGV